MQRASHFGLFPSLGRQNRTSLIRHPIATICNSKSVNWVIYPVAQLSRLQIRRDGRTNYPKRLFNGLQPDLKALAILNNLKIKNAETIFGAVAAEIEASGVEMLDARSLLDDQLASEGLMTSGKIKVSKESIEHGIKIAKGITELDIGQGAVVRKGTVLAVEAYEGTDPMLKRAGSFKTDGLIFVKTVKRKQNYRFDVPVFGERTLEVMLESGIQTAALEVDRVIMLDKMKLLKRAAKLKIELIGYS